MYTHTDILYAILIQLQVQKLRLKFYEQCKQVDIQLREYQNILEDLSSKCDVTKAAFITFNDCVGAYLAKKVYTVV